MLYLNNKDTGQQWECKGYGDVLVLDGKQQCGVLCNKVRKITEFSGLTWRSGSPFESK